MTRPRFAAVRPTGPAGLCRRARASARAALLASVVWAGCAAPAGEVRADDEPQRPAGVPVDVQVATPVRREVVRSVELPASVKAFEAATIYSKVSGYLASIEVDIGDRVQEGQLIATIDVPEIRDQHREAEAELAATRASYASAEAELERAQAELALRELTHQRLQAVRAAEPDVLAQQTVDEASAELGTARASVRMIESRMQRIESEVMQVEAASQRLQTLVGFSRVTAPFGGIVTHRYSDPGALLQAATSSQSAQRIVTVASLDTVRLLVDVPEAEAPFVQVGDRARVTVDALPGRRFEGAVARFAGVLDTATRTMRTEIDLANPEWILRPGMYGRATLTLDERENVLTVPADALHADEDGSFVYTVSDGVVQRIDVEPVVGNGVIAEVTAGLDGTERVVVTARGPISDGRQADSVEDWSP